jgi:putative transposase
LLIVPPTMPVSKAVQLLKGSSSKHLNDTRAAGSNFAGQEGYAGFSVNESQSKGVVQYIKNQAEHHAERSYEEEFLEFLKKFGLEYDPQHVFG